MTWDKLHSKDCPASNEGTVVPVDWIWLGGESNGAISILIRANRARGGEFPTVYICDKQCESEW